MNKRQFLKELEEKKQALLRGRGDGCAHIGEKDLSDGCATRSDLWPLACKDLAKWIKDHPLSMDAKLEALADIVLQGDTYQAE